MQLSAFERKLVLPAGFDPPRRLLHEDLVATVLGREDLDDDVRGINSSLEVIRRTRGGGWPESAVSPEFNYIDLIWHECEFRERFSFSYVVRDTHEVYLGCAYLYPLGRRTELSEEIVHHDVDVSWWVTGDAYAAGWYEKLHAALRRWVSEDFPFTDPYWSNRELPPG